MMKASLIDTNILSMFFRGHSNVIQNFQTYVVQHHTIQFSIITYYEIVSGLAHRDANKQLESFLQFSQHNVIVPFNQAIANISANLYADLRKKGQPIDDIDLLIAGTALYHDLTLITHNRKHFDRITDLNVEDWSVITSQT